jgi:L-aspartate oxidase
MARGARPRRPQPDDADLLIVGSGIGGLSLALRVAPAFRVVVVTKKRDFESNTNYAQGGIAAALGPGDSTLRHERDTLAAGAGLCDRRVVRALVREGPACVAELVEWGVRFSRGERGFELGREGGHSRRRIVHAADTTGREIERALLAALSAHPNVHMMENHLAVDLLLGSRMRASRRPPWGADQVWGAYVLDRQTGGVVPLRARATVLATGGSGKVYLYTSNPDIATGDGLAMAYRAGAEVSNLEFVQFHPTCLYHPAARSFLITEAVRGEGAVLRNLAGERFMPAHHRQAELAPRDIVARAIDHEMKRRGDKFVLLDFSPIGRRRIAERFPAITRRCRELGLDPAREPLPVVPAAHYQCGGVSTDLAGRTTLGRLYAVGEVAMTGLHGANRLASNSLLEAVVMARRAAASLALLLGARDRLPPADPWREEGTRVPALKAGLSHNWEAVRRLMWDRVGIVRSDERLESAAQLLATLEAEIQRDYGRYRLSADLVELRNLGLVADLVVRSAIWRRESRGLHYTLDHPRPVSRFRRPSRLVRPRRRGTGPRRVRRPMLREPRP